MAPARTSVSIVIPGVQRRVAGWARRSIELSTFLARQPWDWEVRVVDDGSTDGTCRVVARARPLNADIVLQREPHRGKGGAVKAGLLAARGAVPIHLRCGSLDAGRGAAALSAAAAASVRRRDRQPRRRRRAPRRRAVVRHLAGRVFNFAVQRLSRLRHRRHAVRIQDVHGRRRRCDLSAGARVDGWAFDIEVLCIARARGLRIVEVPIEWHYRRASQVSLLRDGVGMFRELIRIGRPGAAVADTPGPVTSSGSPARAADRDRSGRPPGSSAPTWPSPPSIPTPSSGIAPSASPTIPTIQSSTRPSCGGTRPRFRSPRRWWSPPHFYPARDVAAFTENLVGISVLASPIFWLTRQRARGLQPLVLPDVAALGLHRLSPRVRARCAATTPRSLPAYRSSRTSPSSARATSPATTSTTACASMPWPRP